MADIMKSNLINENSNYEELKLKYPFGFLYEPRLIEYHLSNGKVKLIIWDKKMIDKHEHYAYEVTFYESGNIESYSVFDDNGLKHTFDKSYPCKTFYDLAHSPIKCLMFYNHGINYFGTDEYHLIGYSENGIITKKYSHDENGNEHSWCDKPSFISYYESGKVKEKYYHNHGNLHRIGGPTYILYNEYDEIVLKQYHIRNKLVKEQKTNYF